MKKMVLIIMVGGLLVSCKSTRQSSAITHTETQESNPVKKRVLPLEDLATFTSVDDLVKYYPDSKPVNGTGLFEEGTVERNYTILYKDTFNEIIFTWENGKVYDVAISEDGMWASKVGIRVGMPYDELVLLNQAPIKVYGFGWDYGGAVDWNEGKLQNSGVQVFLAPEGDVASKFLGDQIITPTESELQTLNLRVAAVIYSPQ